MGKNKLKKFAEIEELPFVFQYPQGRLKNEDFPYRGQWNKQIFKNSGPIVLELGCGKGEYTVALSRKYPARNYIGIDIKGARLWSGAKLVEKYNIENAVFLRTEIENILSFFESGEVEEIWITFPDPQMQKTRKRLTSTRFLNLYLKILKKGGMVHLKTDSPFLYEYTRRVVNLNGFPVIEDTDDLYGSGKADPKESIKTFYESQWLDRGKKIKFISFIPVLNHEELLEPEADDIPKDDYRAYARHTITNKQISEP